MTKKSAKDNKPVKKVPVKEEPTAAANDISVKPPEPDQSAEEVIAVSEIASTMEESTPARPWYRRRLIVISGVVVVVLLVAGGVFLFARAQTGVSILPLASSPKNEASTLVDKVGRLLELPTGEQPTIATVSDVSKLQGQPFFAHGQNGDKVLIFAKAKKAVLYRPSIDKIIEVGPVETTTATASSAGELAQKEPLTVALYNGTTSVGLTRKVEASLKEFSSVATKVIDRENASSSAYPTSVVVDLTGGHTAAAKQLASFAKGTVGPLPQGEVAPKDADILIILGKSYLGE